MGYDSYLGKPSKISLEVGKRESDTGLEEPHSIQEVLSQDLLNRMNGSMARESVHHTTHRMFNSLEEGIPAAEEAGKS